MSTTASANATEQKPNNFFSQYENFIQESYKFIRLDQPDTIDKGFQLMEGILLEILGNIYSKITPTEIDILVREELSQVTGSLKAFLNRSNPKNQNLIETIKKLYLQGPQHPQFAKHLLLASLALRPHEVQDNFDWNTIPNNCFERYISFKFDYIESVYPEDSSKHFKTFTHSAAKLLNYVNIETTPLSRIISALEITINALGRQFFMMSNDNLLPYMQVRYELIKKYTQIAYSSLSSEPFQEREKANQKIKLGVFSKSLLAGVETHAALVGISKLDRKKYDITLFHLDIDTGHYDDKGFQEELNKAYDRIVNLPFHDTQKCIETIRSYDLDLLWHQSHLGLFEASYVSFALIHKLARVQCATLVMHAATTGNPHFQYFLNATPVFPDQNWDHEFSEKVISLKGCPIYFPSNWGVEANVRHERKGLGIPDDAIVYFAGSAAGKHTYELDNAWIQVLKKVDNSYLIMYPFNPSWAPTIKTILTFYKRLKLVIENNGIDPKRVIVLNNVNVGAIEHMHRWGDVYLSSFPYNGVTSLNDAIRAGIPALCVTASYSRGNGDATVLHAYGLDELISRTPEDFINLAAKIGNDTGYRNEVKKRVAEAWAARYPTFKESIATDYAAAIDDIVAREFGC